MIPIKRIVLYKHGLASIERVGTVTDNQEIELYFHQKEMNNVLKSLTAVDLSGKGMISSISYDNDKPFQKKLQEAALTLDSNNLISDLLQKHRGCDIIIKVKGENEPISGIVIGINERETVVGEKVLTKQYEVCLFQSVGGGIRAIALNDIVEYHFTDDKIMKAFREVLTIYGASRNSERKKLSISTQGKGQRDISVAYTNDSPIWKVTYRIVLLDETTEDNDAHKQIESNNNNDVTMVDDHSSDASHNRSEQIQKEVGEKDQHCYIQGWAIIDNTSDESWKDVSLTLVSGSPLSVQVDLVSPTYSEVQASQPVYSRPSVVRANRVQPPLQQMQQMQQMPMPQQMMMNNVVHLMDLSAGGSNDVTTQEVGNLFKYEIDHTVSIEKNKSALVPIVNTKCIGPRVLVYNMDRHQNGHPNASVLFTNTSQLTLESGPVAFFDQSTYIGETLMEVIKPKQTKFLEYAIESAIEIYLAPSVPVNKTYRCMISHGNLYTYEYRIITTEYKIRSKLTKEQTLYLEHRFNKEAKLVSEHKPTNPHPINNYIFKTSAAPLTTSSFKVEEQVKMQQSHALSSIDHNIVNTWLSNKFIDKSSYDTLCLYVKLAEEIQMETTNRNAIIEKNNNSKQNQERLRRLIETLTAASESAVRKQYLNELLQEEANIKKWNSSILLIEDQIKKLKENQREILNTLKMDRTLDD